MDKKYIELSNGYLIESNLLNDYERERGYVSWSTMMTARKTDLVLFNELVKLDSFYDMQPFCEDLLQEKYDSYLSELDPDERELEDIYDYQLDHLDAFQYYAISLPTARILTDFNIITFYNDELDLYILPVNHYGTGWDYVLTDIKIERND